MIHPDNDERIIQALEICLAPNGATCCQCPYHEHRALCKTRLSMDTLEFVKRLHHENKTLRQENASLAERLAKDTTIHSDANAEE